MYIGDRAPYPMLVSLPDEISRPGALASFGSMDVEDAAGSPLWSLTGHAVIPPRKPSTSAPSRRGQCGGVQGVRRGLHTRGSRPRPPLAHWMVRDLLPTWSSAVGRSRAELRRGSAVVGSLAGGCWSGSVLRRHAASSSEGSREMETISRRAPMPSSAVAACRSETLAKANSESVVSGRPSFSRTP